MKDPLKQGLKQILSVHCNYKLFLVEVKDPLKQGLKQNLTEYQQEMIKKVEVKDPLKQGLKQIQKYYLPLFDYLLK